MSGRQLRRSVSMRPRAWLRLREVAAKLGVTPTQAFEQAIHKFADEKGATDYRDEEAAALVRERLDEKQVERQERVEKDLREYFG